ncbi:MAG: hypothetical protein LBS92_03860, partial [Candidatus Methanoplasma sp.]|nr:hypothetical protein [Candidatus Methanoplasma sp.]
VSSHPDFYTVTGAADGGSVITPSGSSLVARGGSISFEFSASRGYAIADVVVDGASVPSAVASGSYTFSGVASSHVISVTSKLAVPASGDGTGNGGDGSGEGKGGNDGSDDGGDGGSGLSGAVLLAIAAALIAAAAAVYWFVFGPGRSFEVVKVTSSVPIVGKDKTRYKRAYRFSVEGDANVRYRIGEDGAWKAPLHADGGGYEIPRGDVTATVTIEAE